MANAIAQHFTQKLPISRFQRDLSDSTVMRNHGVAQGYAVAGWLSLLRGIDRVEPHLENLEKDLDSVSLFTTTKYLLKALGSFGRTHLTGDEEIRLGEPLRTTERKNTRGKGDS